MRETRWKALRQPLVLLLFLLPSLFPLVQLDRIPCTHDGVFHYYRVVVIRDLLRHGVLFSRWVPQLALGYGYPFFNYREPLPYLVGGALYAVGLPVPLVLGLLYAIAALAATWGAFVEARAWVGEPGAWIAALAYGLGAYMLLDSLRRGNLPESLALGMVPWCLVAFRKLIERGRGWAFVSCIVLLVMLFLTHNISSLLLAPFLGGYVILLAWQHRERRTWPWAFVAVAVAVLVTTWFWLPALAEQSYVQLHLSRTTRNNDFRYNFLNWSELLLTLPAAYDPAYLNPPMRVWLGVPQVVLGVAGLTVGLVKARRWPDRLLLLYFALTVIGYGWMSTSASLGVWERFPALAFVQFPWRMTGRALLPLSLLAAWVVPAGELQRWRWRAPIAAAATLAIVVLSWPDTYPPKGMCPVPPRPELRDLYGYEQQGWLGMDPESSYFPIWVERHPADTQLADEFASGELPDRLDVSTLPTGAEVLESRPGLLAQTVVLRTPSAFVARWNGLYFPGWYARVDGEPVPVTPEDETGLLLFSVPAGEHTIRVAFGASPLRRWASLISVVGLGLGLVLLAGYRWLSLRLGWLSLTVPGYTEAVAAGDSVWFGGLALLAVVVLAAKLLWIDRSATPLRRSRLSVGELPNVAQRLAQPYADGLRLLGYQLSAASIRADAELQVDLLWEATARPTQEYRTSVLLIGADGLSWSPAGTLRPRGHEPAPPTTLWEAGQYAYDPHIVTPLAGTPPGDYSVVVSAFSRETLTPLSLLDEGGAPIGPVLRLATLTVAAPAAPPSLEALGVAARSDPRVCGPLGLWEAALDREAAAPGELLALRTVWEAVSAPDSALEVHLSLVDAAGRSVSEWIRSPVAAWWPTDRWQAGDRWAGRHVLRLPGSLASGTYRFVLSLPGCEAAMTTLPIEVIAPERAWDVPADIQPMDVVFGTQVRLAGTAFAPDPRSWARGDRLTVRLAWQALAEMETAYRVYLHLLDSTGRVVAQDDGEPAAWSRPTTGWAVGEVIIDARELSVPSELPAGRYRLRVGLYEVDGPRLLIAEGDDGVTLAEFDLP